jgi:predicted PurR-regulated permease PerM
MSVKEAPGWLRDHSSRIMTAAIVLALLYLGRSALIPLALAIMLSLLVAPLVRALRRLRVGRTSSVLVAVAALAVLCLGLALALGTQMLRIAASLPQYESNVQLKLRTFEEVTVGIRQVMTPSGLNGTPRAVIEKFVTGHSQTTLRTPGVSWSVRFASSDPRHVPPAICRNPFYRLLATSNG